MKDIFKTSFLLVVGLVVAIVIYPVLHESGHAIAAWFSDTEISELEFFPTYNILCKLESINRKDIILIGFSGSVFPLIISGNREPNKFWLWYIWFVFKNICLMSFVISLWALLFYHTKAGIPNDDIVKVLEFVPALKNNFLGTILFFAAIVLVQLIRSRPIKRFAEFFNV